MRAFGVASALIILLAVVGAFGLHFAQESASTAYSTIGARLDKGEAVNFYAREVKPETR
jgi:hypothetical protein